MSDPHRRRPAAGDARILRVGAEPPRRRPPLSSADGPAAAGRSAEGLRHPGRAMKAVRRRSGPDRDRRGGNRPGVRRSLSRGHRGDAGWTPCPRGPSPIGYIRAYATALGLDPDAGGRAVPGRRARADERCARRSAWSTRRPPRRRVPDRARPGDHRRHRAVNVAQRAMMAAAPPPPLALRGPDRQGAGPDSRAGRWNWASLPAPVESTTPRRTRPRPGRGHRGETRSERARRARCRARVGERRRSTWPALTATFVGPRGRSTRPAIARQASVVTRPGDQGRRP